MNTCGEVNIIVVICWHLVGIFKLIKINDKKSSFGKTICYFFLYLFG